MSDKRTMCQLMAARARVSRHQAWSRAGLSAALSALLITGCSAKDRDVTRVDGGSGGAGDAASDAEAAACPADILEGVCGKCPPEMHPVAIYGACGSGYKWDCAISCGTFVMCSLSAPCRVGWKQTATTWTEPCSGLGTTRANGDNAIVCEVQP